MKLLCRLLGHKWDVVSLDYRFEWCSRCAKRRNNQRS
ncbi:DUF1660 domain-containing protein [Sphingobium sp. PNB]|nr:DUF1660 domain-containing protein [Sphingobium sp. PNB]